MRGYRFCLLKAYLDKGVGLTNYFKYFMALFALASMDVKTTLIICFIYAIFCFALGYFWYKYDFIEGENEVSNRFNPFVKEMRGFHSAKRSRSNRQISR